MRLLTRVTFTNRLGREEEMAWSKSSRARGTVGRHGEGRREREIEARTGGAASGRIYSSLYISA